MLEDMNRWRVYGCALACAAALASLLAIPAYFLKMGAAVFITLAAIAGVCALALPLLLGRWFSHIKKEVQGLQASANSEKRRLKQDALTGAYDKDSTLYLAERFLHGEGEEGVHGLMMLHINGPGAQEGKHGGAPQAYVAEKARALFRQTDILGRLGEDQLVVFLKNVHSRAQLEKQSSALLQALGQAGMQEGLCCIGAAIYREDAKDFATLLQKAESALVRARQAGGGYALFDAALDDVF